MVTREFLLANGFEFSFWGDIENQTFRGTYNYKKEYTVWIRFSYYGEHEVRKWALNILHNMEEDSVVFRMEYNELSIEKFKEILSACGVELKLKLIEKWVK